MPVRVFLSHSSKSAFAAKVRDGVYDALTKKGFEVQLDKARLDPGDMWRAKLHRWLATCQAAVILFSRDAVGDATHPGSEWVQKEATILTWRQALNDKLLIVPALLGDVTRSDTERNGFSPLAVTELQFAKADTIDESDANAEVLIQRIVASFDGIVPPPADSELTEWVRQVGVRLRKVDESDLAAAALRMKIDTSDWQDASLERYETFAYQLLFSKLDDILAGLWDLRTMPSDQLRAFLALILPVWVSAESARAIVPAMRSPDDDGRYVAINTSSPDLAELYLRRATCCSPRAIVVRSSGVRGEDPDMAIRAFETAFRRRLNVTSPHPDALRLACIKQPQPWFALIGNGALAKDVLSRLRAAYPRVTFVLVSGREFPVQAQLGLLQLHRVVPELDDNAELSAETFISGVHTALGIDRPDNRDAQ